MAADLVWRSVDELLEVGLERSPVVLINEAHAGLRRCRRTRELGRQLLPVGHHAGVRRLAMEALTPADAESANAIRRLGHKPSGYLEQDDMRALIGDALALGWTLHAYEADLATLPKQGADASSMGRINGREAEQAANLARIAREGGPLIVWCGNHHFAKTQLADSDWRPMGCVLREDHGIDAFAIDQTATVRFPRHDRVHPLLEQHVPELTAHGGSAGLLAEDMPSWCSNGIANAYVFSIDNEMT